MRVRFPRLPDHQRAYALVERDDGVRYRLYGGTDPFPGSQLPHDLRHLIVERELGLTDGIWAGIAAGAVLAGMRYAGGRRPPHADQRSQQLIRAFRTQGLRAELLADLVESVAVLDNPTVTQIRRLARTKLAGLPDAEDMGLDPAAIDPAAIDPAAIAAAATAMQVEASRWARLRVGEALSYQWPPEPPRARYRVVPRAAEPPAWGDGRVAGRDDRSRRGHPAPLPRGRPGRLARGGGRFG
jgi:hypothetical protein